MQRAVLANDLEEVNRLLDDPKIVAVAAADGNRALALSAAYHPLKTQDIANRLLDIPAVLDAAAISDKFHIDRLWFLEWAISKGFLTTVQKLLKSKDVIAQLEQPSKTGKLVNMNMTLFNIVRTEDPRINRNFKEIVLRSILSVVSPEVEFQTLNFVYDTQVEMDGLRKMKEKVCWILGKRLSVMIAGNIDSNVPTVITYAAVSAIQTKDRKNGGKEDYLANTFDDAINRKIAVAACNPASAVGVTPAVTPSNKMIHNDAAAKNEIMQRALKSRSSNTMD